MSKITVFLGLLACAGVFEVALAHGGGIHDGNPLTSGYPAVVIKRSQRVTTLPYAIRKYGSRASLTGTIQVASFLYKNCSNDLSSALVVDVTVTTTNLRNRPVPLANAILSGGVFTGACMDLTASNVLVEINKSPDLESRYMWFDEAVTNSAGRIVGYGVNDGKPRNANFRSVVFFDHAEDIDFHLYENVTDYLQNRALFCATLGAATPGWATALNGQGIVC